MNPLADKSNGTGVSRRAFTLIELILVMALLAIVLAVSAPTLSSFFHGRTLDSEARRFVSLTRYGQSRAVGEGVPMALWIDTKERTYGLQAEPGFVPMDNKAVDFTLGQDLQIGVADLVVPVTQLSQTRQTAQTDASRPRLYFEPDGSIGDGSPQTIMIREIRGETIWVTRSRNGFNYEISTNAFQRTSR